MKTRHAFCALLLFNAAVANAAPVVFSGLDPNANAADPRPNSTAAASAFDLAAGALGAVSIIDFESAPVGSFVTLSVAPGVSIGSNQSIRNSPLSTPERLFGYNTTAGGENFVSFFGGSLTFTFSTPVYAFGGYFSGVQLAGETITYTDGSTEVIPIPNPGSGLQFLGFTDAGKAISSILINVQIGSTGDIIGLDDVRYGVAAASVPEGGMSLLLLGLAAGSLLILRHGVIRRPVSCAVRARIRR